MVSQTPYEVVEGFFEPGNSQYKLSWRLWIDGYILETLLIRSVSLGRPALGNQEGISCHDDYSDYGSCRVHATIQEVLVEDSF